MSPFLMNSKDLQCGNPGSQSQPSCSLVPSLNSTLELLGKALKFPIPRPIKSEYLNRKPRPQDH